MDHWSRAPKCLGITLSLRVNPQAVNIVVEFCLANVHQQPPPPPVLGYPNVCE